jgi:AAA domain
MSTPPNGIGLADPTRRRSDYGRWLIHGPQGSGKTTLGSSVAELGQTLFIDLVGEKGTRSFEGAPWEPNITISRPSSITALDDVYWWLAAGDHPYRAVVLDSLTAAQKMSMRFMLGHNETAVREIKQGGSPADQRTWGQTLDIMTDMATFWFALADANGPHPMHVVMTAQTKITEDDTTGTVQRTPDVQKGALSITLASPDYIVYTDLEENQDAIADESLPPVRHIVRFGNNLAYRTKARLPYGLRGKIPPILGRKKPVTLLALSKILGIGGLPTPAPTQATAVAAPALEATNA